MKVTVVPGRLLAPEHIKAWSALQEADSALSSPFLSPDFTLAVAAVRADVTVGILEEDGRVVGFFPHQRGWLPIGCPVGGLINDLQGLIVQSGVDWNAAELVRGCGLFAWKFSRVLASQQGFAPFHLRRDVSGFIDLSLGYSAYAAERRAALEAQYVRQKAQKLERDVGPLRFEVHSRDPLPLATLMRWKAERYAGRGYADVFAIPWVRGVLERIHATQTSRFGGILSVLYAGDEIAAAHMGVRSHNLWHSWVSSYNPRFARYSPGLLLFLKMAESASTMGLQCIELGGGDYPYKRTLMNRSVMVAEGTVDRAPAFTAARRWRYSSEEWIRRSPLLRPPARTVLRTFRKLRQRLPT